MKITELKENQVVHCKTHKEAKRVYVVQELLHLFGVSGQLPLPCERFDAEDWLGEHKNIWNHPRVTDRNDKESYEVADLMAEFANWYYGNGNCH